MPSATGIAVSGGRYSSPAGTVRVSPVSGKVSVSGSSSSTVMPLGPVLGSSSPNSAARAGRPPRWISSRIAGSAIANIFTQYWKACT